MESQIPLEMLPNSPDPSDASSWGELNALVISFTAELNEQIVKKTRVTVNPIFVGGVPVLEVRPLAVDSASKCIIYLHGGAYCLYSAASTLTVAAPVATEARLRVLSIDYSLAPLAKWREIYAEIERVIFSLLSEGYAAEDICILGDSAGGALAVGAALMMRAKGENPAALALLSPWADIAPIGLSYELMAKAETAFDYERQLKNCALAYADSSEFCEPMVSPVYAAYDATFPPTLIQGGTREIFLSSFVRLYQAMDQAGGRATLDLYEGMPHVFWGAAPDLPESAIARSKVVKFMRQNLRLDKILPC